MQTLNGKTVLITGGAGGIGLGMARAFAAEGARIALADIDPERLGQAATALREGGAEAVSVRLDVADPGAWSQAVSEVEAGLGPVDVLCNNAGMGARTASVAESDPALWRKVLEVNLLGPFYGCRTVLPGMIARGGEGHVVFTASLSGLRANPLMSAYGASKHGLVGLSDALRAEMHGTRIGVSIVYPGMTRTEFRANSAKLSGDNTPPAALNETIAKLLSQAMDPDFVGQRIVGAVLAGEYHVFTHIGDKPHIERIFAERLAAFGENADPSYVDDVSALKAAVVESQKAAARR